MPEEKKQKKDMTEEERLQCKSETEGDECPECPNFGECVGIK
jgi:hypothetical protein